MERKWSVSLVGASAILISGILACGSTPTVPPTDTLVPVATLAPTETSVPETSVPETSVPATPTAPVYYTEKFDELSGQWAWFAVDSSDPQAPALMQDLEGVSANWTGGRLALNLEGKNRTMYFRYMSYTYKDIRLEAVAENRGSDKSTLSLICRYSKEEGWYEFKIANNGIYKIYHAKFTLDDKVVYSKLADGGSNKIKPGKYTNNYGISCKGHTLTLYINGFETRRIDDNQYALREGGVGVSASSFDDVPVKIEFDSVTISKP